MNLFQRPKIGLALGGGGARGLAHIGVLKILEQEQIPIDFIAGTSAGAVIGAMYALNPDAREIQIKIEELFNSSYFHKLNLERIHKKNGSDTFFSHVVTFLKERIVINFAYKRLSLIGNRKFIDTLNLIIQNKDITQTAIPFCVVATDLVSGNDVILKTGDLISAVTASGSIPGFLPPVTYSNNLLLDGGISQKVPVDAAIGLGAEIVIAVDVSQKLEKKTEYDNILEILNRTGQITSATLTKIQLQKADLVLKPEVGQFHWSEFKNLDNLISAGENEARRQITKLKKIIRMRQIIKKNNRSYG
ncbi:hypothetical protein B6I21_05975 [candidate division KSB1 bacterium 4572_119]|nr:MAG: hypothetical protein B6I21_05975 [candidate division KSB1 bacterium 4572_119]